MCKGREELGSDEKFFLSEEGKTAKKVSSDPSFVTISPVGQFRQSLMARMRLRPQLKISGVSSFNGMGLKAIQENLHGP